MRSWAVGVATAALISAAAPFGHAEATVRWVRPPLCEVPSAPPPVGTTQCPGLRPGALISNGFFQCTAGFLFQGSDRSRYMATAGHCAVRDISSNPGELSWPRGGGLVAYDQQGRRIGVFVYAMLRVLDDFALIRLDPGVPSSAAVCHFGGPTGIERGRSEDPMLVHHYGQGLGVREAAPGRTGVAPDGVAQPSHVAARAVVVPGDSGGPMITSTGLALGVVIGVSVGGNNPGQVLASRLSHFLPRASTVLRVRLNLMLAPLAP